MKNRYLFLTAIALLFFVAFKVDAATCSTDELNALRKEAENVDFATHLQVYDDEHSSSDMYGYDLTISNFSEDLYFSVGAYERLLYFKNGIDGVIDVKSAFFSGGYKAPIKVYASDKTNCSGELITTRYLNIPYYNFYSTREECKNYQKYNICKIDTNTEDVTEELFLETIEKIKNNQLEDDTQTLPKEKNKNVFELYWENKKITIPITILMIVIIGVVIYYFINKNRKRIKIDLEGKNDGKA